MTTLSLKNFVNIPVQEMKMKKLTLSKTNTKIAGVCGGLGEYFGVDATIIRILWILGTLISLGTGILAYLVCWALIPNAEN